jgi:1,2-phenylacetyl-CoA epoxidase catalytic subunit
MQSSDTLIARLSSEERQHIASWAAKTSRTEEWTGAQVVRLLAATQDRERFGPEADLLRQAAEELTHARLYAAFAQQFKEPAWLSAYAQKAQNFSQSSFTALLRRMDATPVSHDPGARVRFLTGLFFLDLAGLMTVNVYEESPFPELQEIALQIRTDEGRHVHDGREWLLSLSAALPAGRELLRQAVDELLPDIDAFFGGDESPVQATLQKVGIRKTPNAQLKAKFRDKITALLHLG